MNVHVGKIEWFQCWICPAIRRPSPVNHSSAQEGFVVHTQGLGLKYVDCGRLAMTPRMSTSGTNGIAVKRTTPWWRDILCGLAETGTQVDTWGSHCKGGRCDVLRSLMVTVQVGGFCDIPGGPVGHLTALFTASVPTLYDCLASRSAPTQRRLFRGEIVEVRAALGGPPRAAQPDAARIERLRNLLPLEGALCCGLALFRGRARLLWRPA